MLWLIKLSQDLIMWIFDGICWQVRCGGSTLHGVHQDWCTSHRKWCEDAMDRWLEFSGSSVHRIFAPFSVWSASILEAVCSMLSDRVHQDWVTGAVIWLIASACDWPVNQNNSLKVVFHVRLLTYLRISPLQAWHQKWLKHNGPGKNCLNDCCKNDFNPRLGVSQDPPKSVSLSPKRATQINERLGPPFLGTLLFAEAHVCSIVRLGLLQSWSPNQWFSWSKWWVLLGW